MRNWKQWVAVFGTVAMVAGAPGAAALAVYAAEESNETLELMDEESARGSSYSDLQAAVTRAEQEVRNAQDTVRSKEDALEDAQDKAAEAQAAYDKAVTEAEAATDRIAKAQAEIDAGQAAVERARSDKDAADQKASEAETALAELQQAVTDAENEVARIEARDREAIDAAQAVINQGSAGFFKDAGENGNADATIAYNILVNQQDDGYLMGTSEENRQSLYNATNIGAEGDATSLENMKRAIEVLKEASDTRVNQDERQAYNVSYILTAMGQINANWAYENKNVVNGGAHSYVFDTYENLSNGHTSAAEVVDAYYDNEKKRLSLAVARKRTILRMNMDIQEETLRTAMSAIS